MGDGVSYLTKNRHILLGDTSNQRGCGPRWGLGDVVLSIRTLKAIIDFANALDLSEFGIE